MQALVSASAVIPLGFFRQLRSAIVHAEPAGIASLVSFMHALDDEQPEAASTVDLPGLLPELAAETIEGGVFSVTYQAPPAFCGEVDLSRVTELPRLKPDIPLDLLDDDAV